MADKLGVYWDKIRGRIPRRYVDMLDGTFAPKLATIGGGAGDIIGAIDDREAGIVPVRYADMADGTHALVVTGVGGSGGAHAASHQEGGADEIASGVPDGTKFLRDDFSWQSVGAGSHPDLATHDALGLATDAELATHAAAGNPHPVYTTDAEATALAAAEVATHAAAGDPHPAYLTPAEHTTIGDGAPHHAPVTLGADADVLLGLSAQQLTLDTQTANTVFAGPASAGPSDPTFRALVDADIPAAIARDSEVTAAVTAHEAAGDPHPTYTTAAESDVIADISSAAAVTAHEAAGDPHTGYVRVADANWVDLTDGGASTLHSHAGGGHPDLATHDALGLATDAELTTHAGAADPHPGYQTPAEHTAIGDAAPHHAELHTITDAADHTFPGGTTTFLRADGTFAAPPGGAPSDLNYNPGSSTTIVTGSFRVYAKRMVLTGTDRLTVEGDGRRLIL